MEEKKQVLFFIAIIPPEEIVKEITSFKHDFSGRFGSKAALKVIPHITLKAPFKIPFEEKDNLMKWFDQLELKDLPVSVVLENFSCFPKKHAPVIFIQPLKSPELEQLQKYIVGTFHERYPGIEITENEIDFHPHITIAYRDLKPEQFEAAWKEYKTKKYNASFLAGSFCLLQHDEKKWNIIASKKTAT